VQEDALRVQEGLRTLPGYGALCGIFDQRAAEKLTHRADLYGFAAISVGGVISWLLECLSTKLLTPDELGVCHEPFFSHRNFHIESDSMHNAVLGIGILDAIVKKQGLLNMEDGARRLARHLARERGKEILDLFVYSAFGRRGWMVPNQYWTPGVLSPIPIMGKYYMYYGEDSLPPRELGRRNAERFKKELTLDNIGFCRFHRNWAEDMVPEIVDSLYGLKKEFLQNISMTASRINSRNASVFWESERNFDYIYTFMKRRQFVEGDSDPELLKWIEYFEREK